MLGLTKEKGGPMGLIIAAIMTVVGLALVTAGVALVYPPAALLVVGAFFVTCGLLGDFRDFGSRK